MNYSIVSVQTLQKFFAVVAVLAIVFGPVSSAFAVAEPKISFCHVPSSDSDKIQLHENQGAGSWNGHDGGGTGHEFDFLIESPEDMAECLALIAAQEAVDLSITKSADDTEPAEGGTVVYTITVTNNDSNDEATNVVVEDVIPAGTTFVSSNPIADTSSPWTWEFASIAGGDSKVIEVTVTVDSSTGGDTISNTATVEADETDPNPGNNTSQEDIVVDETIVVDLCTDPLATNNGQALPCTYPDPIPGCTDRLAVNWDEDATVDDGSCSYMCVYSDVTTQEGGVDSFVVPKHPAWATISGADWIWGDAAVVDGSTTTIQTFTKIFNVNGAPTAASLEIASDNGYRLVVNGTTIVDRLNELSTYSPSTIHNILTEINANTQNTIEITVKNPAWQGENPAGLAYKLTTTDASCEAIDPDLSSITIVKEFAGEAPESWSFEFEGDLGQGGFTLSDETPSRTFENLGADDYSISEVVDTEVWAFPAIECIDSDENVLDVITDGGYLNVSVAEGEDVTCTFTNRELPAEPTQCLDVEENLLQNGSFEAPVVTANGGQWENFAVVTGWDLLADGLELWKGLFGGANDGLQNAELDGNASAATAISQTVATVVGNEYKLTYDFAARPNTNLTNNVLEVVIDGIVVDTVSADGTGDGSIDWGTYTYEFTAATTSTVVEFRDAGTDDGYGTLLDGTELCLTEDNSENEPDMYRVFGQVWHDENENDERDFFEDESSEDILEGWLMTITDNDEFVATTTSDEYGNYEFEVPAGEYVITQTTQEGWALTFPNDGSWEVCVPIACEDEETLVEELLSMIVPTAYAAVAANNGPLNFGNVRTTPGYSQGSYGGGGNGRNISLRDNDDDSDEDDEPEGQVLGEATSTMPVGAPNTGAGGAATSYVLHGMVAILASRKGVQVSNGK